MITLITNLSYAIVNGVRLHVSAIAIQPHDPDMPSFGNHENVRVRGFGPDSALEVFDLQLETADPAYELQLAESANIQFIGQNDDGSAADPKPLFTGGIISFADGTQIQLVKESHDERPIDFATYPGASDHFEQLWDALKVKSAEYWAAPAMPVPQWIPVEDVQYLRAQGEDLFRRLNATTIAAVQGVRSGVMG
jgi:hypothetical protein